MFKKLITVLVFLFIISSLSADNQINSENILRTFIDENGNEIIEIIVPGRPPENYRAPVAELPDPGDRSSNIISNFPAFDWSFGCSATSAAMMAAYYDNGDYPDIYTGPTNGGVMPMDNTCWPDTVINGENRHQCPLSATAQGLDGRTTKGHVDDYWHSYGSSNDPYYGNWTQHTYGECTADYMGTNQYYNWQNTDGATRYYFNGSGAPLYDYTSCEPTYRDGCHGLKLFFESRGYTVEHNYSQYIYGYDGNTQGFTYSQFKSEIDAGRPVMIQVEGHSMVGFGYNDNGSDIIYIHDTWDHSDHTMTWGGSYSGMAHYAVGVYKLEPNTVELTADFTADTTSGYVPLTVNFTDQSVPQDSINSWQWDFDNDGTIDSYEQNPTYTYSDSGSYSVSLTVSDGTNSDTETKIDYITVDPLDPPTNLAIDNTGLATWEAPGGGGGGSTQIDPQAADDWTGSTDATAKTETSLVNAIGDVELGWMKFDTSSIPAGATIDSIIFNGYVNETNWPYWSITPCADDPVTTDGATLFANISALTGEADCYSYNNEGGSFDIGWKTYILGGTAIADLEAALANGWFAVGCADRDSGTSYFVNFDGWNEDNPPYLEVYHGGGAMAKLPLKATESNNTNTESRDFLGYNLYLDGSMVEEHLQTEAYQFTELTPGDTYLGGVSADYDAGESEIITSEFTYVPSNEPPVDLYVDGSGYATWSPPPVGGDTIAFDNFDDFTVIDVNADRELTGYNVYLDGDPDGSTTETNYQYTGLTNGETYTSGVTAVYDDQFESAMIEYDFTYTGSEPTPPAENLAGTVVNYQNVQLTWDQPSGSGGMLSYHNGYDANGIGTAGDVEFTCCARFTAEELSDFYGSNLTAVNILIHSADFSSVEIRVYEGGSYGDPGTQVYSEDVTSAVIPAEMFEHTLTSPIPLVNGNEYWMGYYIHATADHPAAVDAGPMEPEKGAWMYFNNAWSLLPELGATLDFNWIIEGVVGGGDVLAENNVSKKATKPSPTDNRVLEGYNVYRDGTLLDYVAGATTTEYLDDENLGNGTYEYSVEAVYTSGVSDPVAIDVELVLPVVENLEVFFSEPNVTLNWDEPGGEILAGRNKSKLSAAVPQTRDLVEYNVYLDGVLDGTTTNTFYQLLNIEVGTYTAGVTAVYEGGYESDPVDSTFTTPWAGEQIIDLIEGWNMISFNVVPINCDMLTIMQPLIDDSVLVKVQDESGQALVNLPGVGWYNGIGDMEQTEGYYIYVNSSCQLSILGNPVGLPVNISLIENWNMISYPCQSSQDGMNVVQPLIDNDKLEKVQNESGQAIVDLPGVGWYNGIGNFVPGEGYYLNVNAAATLTIDTPDLILCTKRKIFSGETAPTREEQHFIPVYEGNGYNNMTFFIRTAAIGEVDLEAGDEIGIFDGDICVGYGAIVDNNTPVYQLTASFDDPQTPDLIDGFVAGNQISYKLWDVSESEEIVEVEASYVTGNNTFSPLGTAFVDLVGTPLGTNNNIPTITLLYENFPNPFSNGTTIKFSLKQESSVKVEIYNIKGQKVKTLLDDNASSGHHGISWDGKNNVGGKVSNGIYFYKMIAGDYSEMKKMILMR